MEMYANFTLTEGEKVLKVAKFRLTNIFVWILIITLTIIVTIGTIGQIISNEDEALEAFFSWGAILIIWFLYRLLNISSRKIILTNYRLYAEKGLLITRERFEAKLYEIDSVFVDVGLFKSGSLTINAQGGISIKIPGVKDVLEFKKAIENIVKDIQSPIVLDDNIESYCRFCGCKVLPDSAFCSSCGKPLVYNNNPTNSSQIHLSQSIYPSRLGLSQPRQANQTTVVVQAGKSNGLGTAGFIFALLGLILSWAPIANFIIWFFGFLFSFIGMFKSPRGLAITGFILSILDIIIIIIIFVIFGSIAALLSRII